jgi:hypothetical protein
VTNLDAWLEKFRQQNPTVIVKIEHNSSIVSVGCDLVLTRLEGADIVVAYWEGKVTCSVYVHRPPRKSCECVGIK